VATDVNRRALWMTKLNARLNRAPNIEVREGSFFEPFETGLDGPPQGPPFETGLDGPPQGPPFETGPDTPPQSDDTFDLIATNPPFVISPATGEKLVYRDSGLPGDRVVEHIVRTGPDHLAEGGWLQVLANWSVVEGRPWDERLGSWLRDDCDALVVQRETLDPASYVELWLKDSGHHGRPDYAQRYDTWLSWLEETGIEGIGFGWINVRLGAGSAGRHELIEWPYDVEQPIGPAIHDWGTAVDDLRGLSDADLLGRTLRARDDVQQETVGRPGAEDPEAIVLRQQRGFRRARTADTVEAAFLGACDGDLSVGQLFGALAQLTDTDADQLATTYLPVVRELVGEGFLEVTTSA
jgi:hypothetical protein